MLTDTELATINSKTTRSFLALAHSACQHEANGNLYNVEEMLEVFLYTYALGLYDPSAPDNYITPFEVRAIYARIREISNV